MNWPNQQTEHEDKRDKQEPHADTGMSSCHDGVCYSSRSPKAIWGEVGKDGVDMVQISVRILWMFFSNCDLQNLNIDLIEWSAISPW